MNINRRLNKKEQKKLVSKTHTGGLPLSIGYSIGVSTKSRRPNVRMNRNKQNG